MITLTKGDLLTADQTHDTLLNIFEELELLVGVRAEQILELLVI